MTGPGRRPDPRAIARLRRWYAWTVEGRWSTRELIWAWTLRVPPIVWNIGWAPSEAEIAAYPGRYLVHADGTAWGPHALAMARSELASRLAETKGIVPGEIGSGAFLFGPPIGELVRCSWTFAAYRAAERHHLAPHADESADEALSRLVYGMGIESARLASAHVGRKKGLSHKTGRRYRKSAGIAAIARALLVWGLIEAGLSHRAAILCWLDWEIALGGPFATSPAVRRASKLAVSGADRDGLREFEESIRGATKQVWVALGIRR